jgi:hypothetical protein
MDTVGHWQVQGQCSTAGERTVHLWGVMATALSAHQTFFAYMASYPGQKCPRSHTLHEPELVVLEME